MWSFGPLQIKAQVDLLDETIKGEETLNIFKVRSSGHGSLKKALHKDSMEGSRYMVTCMSAGAYQTFKGTEFNPDLDPSMEF